ncbi:AAA family ATPase [Candidatus Poriferisodalis sp.]|uniref:AAA family ATPase n=1 Tax=Candidatus Poriferisodalis sp. TaxID=3101277 RepID=UPI003B02DD5A
MPTPTLRVIAGPNGAGKSTFQQLILAPSTLEFVNADLIAAREWPGEEAKHAYEAAALAAARRDELLAARTSFVTETVFSHESKLELVSTASHLGYVVSLYVIIIPEDQAVARVAVRAELGGHDVPEGKVRSRHQRLWSHVVEAINIADNVRVYDNSHAETPFVSVATFHAGMPVGRPEWPPWAPIELVRL